MQKMLTWSIVRYPSNSEFFELQGKYEPYNDGFLLTSIAPDFESFDVMSKIGKTWGGVEWVLDKFDSNNEVSNENLALQIIKEWTEKDNLECLFKRGPILSPCSCCESETE